MTKDRHGCSWNNDEDRQLKALFDKHCSFAEMGEKLGRTWFACKCRCIRLGLIEGSCKNPKYGETPYEPFRVPNPPSFTEIIMKLDPDKVLFNTICGKHEHNDVVDSLQYLFDKVFKGEPTTSKTFTDEELDIVANYFKSRLAKICVQKTECTCIPKLNELCSAEDTFLAELNRVKMTKTMSIEEREKVLTKIA